jgi:pimeloyl-ACP methyl ester carboxylesterase
VVDAHINRKGELAMNTERELKQVERANATAATPVVFIHGLWLLPSSWDRWAGLFEQAGYVALTPSWPDDPETVAAARANPEVLAKKTLRQVADHTAEIVAALHKKPAVIGHSTGGLLAEMLAGRGLSAATVAIDPGVFRGVLPLPVSVLKGVGPFLVNPLTRGRAITLTLDQFKYGWANALDEKEARSSTKSSTSPVPGSLSSRWATRTSTRGPRRRWTRRTPTAVLCSSSMARRITRCRGRSPTQPTSDSGATPA